jgi:hypothetical protein
VVPASGGRLLDGILPHPGPARHLLCRHHALANAGLLLAATLAERLAIEQATDALIDWAGGLARTGPAARC